MWNTPEGERRLEGCERNLVARAVVALHERLIRAARNGRRLPLGIRAFDRLPLETQPYLVLLVGESLLGDDPFPGFYSWNESIVLLLFNQIEGRVRREIALQRKRRRPGAPACPWRLLVLEAFRAQCGGPDVSIGEPPQDPDSTDLDEWSLKILILTDLILWDRDFEDEDLFMDAPPDVAEAMKMTLGIEPDYYSGVPPALSDQDRDRLEILYTALRDEFRLAPARPALTQGRLH